MGAWQEAPTARGHLDSVLQFVWVPWSIAYPWVPIHLSGHVDKRKRKKRCDHNVSSNDPGNQNPFAVHDPRKDNVVCSRSVLCQRTDYQVQFSVSTSQETPERTSVPKVLSLDWVWSVGDSAKDPKDRIECLKREHSRCRKDTSRPEVEFNICSLALALIGTVDRSTLNNFVMRFTNSCFFFSFLLKIVSIQFWKTNGKDRFASFAEFQDLKINRHLKRFGNSRKSIIVSRVK